METEQLLEQTRALAEQGSRENVTLTDAQIIAFLLDNCAYTLPQDAVFFGTVNCSGIAGRIAGERAARVRERVVTPERAAGIEARAYTGAREFGIYQFDTYTGLNWSTVPCILVECGFMSNPEEDVLLNTPEYQQKLADGMVEGIADYMGR